VTEGDDAGPPLSWCDNHCHLDDDRLGPNVIAEARAAGVTTLITVGVDAARSEACIALAAANDGVWATVGLHPHDAVQGVDSIVALLDRPRVVAVGECGLDYFYDHSPREVQRTAFAAQIALARQRRLALVIHTRDSWADTFAVLAAEGPPERTIFHCFTGGPTEARRCLDLGAYLSFSGIVTFKSAVELREAARLCPRDRLLVETDSPYLAPVPFRGRSNTPALLPIVGAALAELRAESVREVAAASVANAAVAFGLPRS
jgi:TatD DNase family protein